MCYKRLSRFPRHFLSPKFPPLVSLAGLIIWVILVLKAYQGQTFKLPVIGEMAEKQANTV